MRNETRVLIVGSGPAGLTAAIYAARANLSPICIEGGPPNLPGGQLMITSEVENFPGFANGILGPELMMAMREQAVRVGAEFVTENVVSVDLSKRPFAAVTDSGQTFLGDTLIISTGASAKWLNLPEETALYGKGVSACATCDGFFFRGKDVIVVGGGDTAMEEANYLTRMANTVTVIHRRDHLRASAIMQKRAFENEKIRFIWDSAITRVHDVTAGKVTGVTASNLITGKEKFVPTDGLFIAIGHQPNTALFADRLKPIRTDTSLRSREQRTRRYQACLPQATSRIRNISKRSRLQAQAVWPPLAPSGSWKAKATRSSFANRGRKTTRKWITEDSEP